jgi:glutamyl-tRNA reductase
MEFRVMPRHVENRVTMLSRVDVHTRDKIQEIAKALGYTYAEEGSQGKLLDAIAQGELILIKSQKGVDTDK